MSASYLSAYPNQLPYDGEVFDLGLILPNPEALYQTLLATAPWQADRVTLFGKTHITRRQVVWMGDKGLNYQYSGQSHHSVAWSAPILAIKQTLISLLHAQGLTVDFNSCLLNYYPDGETGMGYHADDEKVLGKQPCIASLSLGATRKFVFKHRHTAEKVELLLHSGQLIVMAGQTQQHWRHSLPKSKKVKEGRINLTFRYMNSSL